MTNLLFSIVTALVTNVSEHVVPERDSGLVLTSIPPQYRTLPASKTVTTTICRVTNAVEWLQPEAIRTNKTGLSSRIFEIGRVELWRTIETYTEVKTTAWHKDSTLTVTNAPASALATTNDVSWWALANGFQTNMSMLLPTNIVIALATNKSRIHLTEWRIITNGNEIILEEK